MGIFDRLRRGEACGECGHSLARPMRSRKVKMRCTCGAKLYPIILDEYSKLVGVNVLCRYCGCISHIPPTAWCLACRNNLVPDWRTRVLPDERAHSVRNEVAIVSLRSVLRSYGVVPYLDEHDRIIIGVMDSRKSENPLENPEVKKLLDEWDGYPEAVLRLYVAQAYL